MSGMGSAALSWAYDGIPVFPCHHPIRPTLVCSCGKPDCGSAGKHPRTDHGCHDATLDPDQVVAWWDRWPDANIGIATGDPSGMWVLDVDGPEGEAALAALEREHGPLPETMAQTTGRGRHLFWLMTDGRPVKNRARITPELDVRGTGGYVCIAPSLHQSGATYSLENDDRPVEAPAWLLDLVAPVAEPAAERPAPPPYRPPVAEGDPGSPRARVLGMVAKAAERIRIAPEGARNDTVNRECFSIGGYLDAAGVSMDEVAPALEDAALAAQQQPKMVRRSLADGAAAARDLPPDSDDWRPAPAAQRVDPRRDNPDADRARRVRVDDGLDRLSVIAGAAEMAVSEGKRAIQEALSDPEAVGALAELLLDDPDHLIGHLDKLRARYGLASITDALKEAVRDRADAICPTPTSDGDPPPYTDLGNAERFARRFGADVRWCSAIRKGRWLVWTGARWEWDERERAHGLAQETVRRIADEVDALVRAIREAPDADTRERLSAQRDACAGHALASQANARINAIPTQARALPGIAVSPSDLDSHHLLFNALNCTIDLATGTTRAQRREDLLTQMGGVKFFDGTACPTWEAFLAQILPDEEVRTFLRRAVGYALTGDVSEQVWFLLYGDGANGKSTFLEIVMWLLGSYATRLAPGFFEDRSQDPHPTEVMDLKGRRLAAAAEIRPNRRLDEGKVKELTGADLVKARGMNEDFSEFLPTHKLWVAANKLPRISGVDLGIWRRTLVIRFGVTIPEDQRDKGLLAKLKAEGPGILNWALQGYRDWRNNGLKPPPAVREASDEYRANEDGVGQFLDECCELDEGSSVVFGVLYAAYRRWHADSGDPRKALSKKAFGDDLKPRAIVAYSSNGQARRRGVKLIEV